MKEIKTSKAMEVELPFGPGELCVNSSSEKEVVFFKGNKQLFNSYNRF